MTEIKTIALLALYIVIRIVLVPKFDVYVIKMI